MASPVDAARNTSATTSAGTSHTINVGSPAAGTLLIVWIRFAVVAGTVTFTGYTPLVSQVSDDAADDENSIYYRWADGTEGASNSMTTGNSTKMAAICWQVTGASNPATQVPELSTVAVGTTTANTCNATTVTPTGGSKDYLFLALGGMDGEGGTFTAAPTNYTNITTITSGTGGLPATNCVVGGASRQLTAASDDPGAFTHGAAAAGWTAYAMAIHPAPPDNPATFPVMTSQVQIQYRG